ncbi:MAG TPA: hypothetical protein VE177_02155 [Candidatus Binatus sp.]|nr:hypothetical protein [Candidatus Binatus sp.]
MLLSRSETAAIYIWTITTLVLASRPAANGFARMLKFLAGFFLSMVDYFYLRGLPLSWQLHMFLLATAPLW